MSGIRFTPVIIVLRLFPLAQVVSRIKPRLLADGSGRVLIRGISASRLKRVIVCSDGDLADVIIAAWVSTLWPTIESKVAKYGGQDLLRRQGVRSLSQLLEVDLALSPLAQLLHERLVEESLEFGDVDLMDRAFIHVVVQNVIG